MKTKKEIISELKKNIWLMNKFYINALLYVLERQDLIPKVYTEKSRNKIIGELEIKQNDN